MARRIPWLLLAVAAAVALAVCGWWALRFTCDDAYIAFRYVANAHAGRGLVWNPAPFQPVEGYSCFLWVLLLWLCWSVTGVEPPAAANVLSLLCGLGSLLLCARWLMRLELDQRQARWRPLFVLLLLGGLAANATFATWLSSGLETALFGLLLTWWFAECWQLQPPTAARIGRLCTAAALAALTRPDGLLLAAASASLLPLLRLRPLRLLAAASPLLLVLAHLLWRRAYYGDWLPNTYYAKTDDAWPQSGIRYLWAFAIEHGLLLWLPLLLAAGIAARRRWPMRAQLLPRAVAVAALLLHAGYYAVRIGGDHFQYRVLAHLLPLLFASAGWAVLRLLRPPLLAAAALLVYDLGADGIGWLHEAAMRGRGLYAFAAIADRAPLPLQPLLHQYDRTRAWLRWNLVALPRAAHVAVAAQLGAELPPRGDGARIGWDGRPTLVAPAVGLIAWRLPNVAVIDRLGLNDRVIARQPPVRAPAVAFGEGQLEPAFAAADADADRRLDAAELRRALQPILPDLFAQAGELERATVLELLLLIADADGDGRLDLAEATAIPRLLTGRRQMAHDRGPPPGYLDGFRPNVTFGGGHASEAPRAQPLTDAAIRAHEARYR